MWMHAYIITYISLCIYNYICTFDTRSIAHDAHLSSIQLRISTNMITKRLIFNDVSVVVTQGTLYLSLF